MLSLPAYEKFNSQTFLALGAMAAIYGNQNDLYWAFFFMNIGSKNP